jgi:hypothetical protein
MKIKKKDSITTRPIIIPLGINTSFFMNTEGKTEVRMPDIKVEVEETLGRIIELISVSGMIVSNAHILEDYSEDK